MAHHAGNRAFEPVGNASICQHKSQHHQENDSLNTSTSFCCLADLLLKHPLHSTCHTSENPTCPKSQLRVIERPSSGENPNRQYTVSKTLCVISDPCECTSPPVCLDPDCDADACTECSDCGEECEEEGCVDGCNSDCSSIIFCSDSMCTESVLCNSFECGARLWNINNWDGFSPFTVSTENLAEEGIVPWFPEEDMPEIVLSTLMGSPHDSAIDVSGGIMHSSDIVTQQEQQIGELLLSANAQMQISQANLPVYYSGTDSPEQENNEQIPDVGSSQNFMSSAPAAPIYYAHGSNSPFWRGDHQQYVLQQAAAYSAEATTDAARTQHATPYDGTTSGQNITSGQLYYGAHYAAHANSMAGFADLNSDVQSNSVDSFQLCNLPIGYMNADERYQHTLSSVNGITPSLSLSSSSSVHFPADAAPVQQGYQQVAVASSTSSEKVETVRHDRRQKSAPCGYCSKRFASTQVLNNHIATQHEQDRERHRCEQCNKAFTEASGLIKHKNKAHGGERHACKNKIYGCLKTDYRRDNLRRHELICKARSQAIS